MRAEIQFGSGSFQLLRHDVLKTFVTHGYLGLVITSWQLFLVKDLGYYSTTEPKRYSVKCHHCSSNLSERRNHTLAGGLRYSLFTSATVHLKKHTV